MILNKAELRAALGLTTTITDAEAALVELAIREAQSNVCRVLQYDPEYGELSEILPQIAANETGLTSDWWRSDGSRAYRSSGLPSSLNVIQVSKLPIRSVTSLYEHYDARHGAADDAFPASTRLAEGSAFLPEYNRIDSSGVKYCESGLIRRYGGSWPSIPGTVKVAYCGGFTADELDGADSVVNARAIKDAALMLGLRGFRRYTSLGKQAIGGIFTAGPKQSERMGDYQYTIATTAGAVEQLTMGIPTPAEVLAMLQPFINYGITWQ